MANETRELGIDQLEAISGGMKWTPGHKSPYVVDARGGMVTVVGWTFTFDIKGNLSSITH
ncbi:MAG: hypothetical protein H0V72_24405 [Bradyrhizobium sp.]|nr:hypothetical protein [Bradyrhizobium sp.]